MTQSSTSPTFAPLEGEGVLWEGFPGGRRPSETVQSLERLAGQGVYDCVDLLARVQEVQRLYRGNREGRSWAHLPGKEWGPVFVAVVQWGRGSEDWTPGSMEGLGTCTLCVEGTVLTYCPFSAQWRLARVRAMADRHGSIFSHLEKIEWQARAVALVFPMFAKRWWNAQRSAIQAGMAADK